MKYRIIHKRDYFLIQYKFIFWFDLWDNNEKLMIAHTRQKAITMLNDYIEKRNRKSNFNIIYETRG